MSGRVINKDSVNFRMLVTLMDGPMYSAEIAEKLGEDTTAVSKAISANRNKDKPRIRQTEKRGKRAYELTEDGREHVAKVLGTSGKAATGTPSAKGTSSKSGSVAQFPGRTLTGASLSRDENSVARFIAERPRPESMIVKQFGNEGVDLVQGLVAKKLASRKSISGENVYTLEADQASLGPGQNERDAVLELLRKNREGLAVHHIIGQVCREYGASPEQVRNTLTALVDEGAITVEGTSSAAVMYRLAQVVASAQSASKPISEATRKAAMGAEANDTVHRLNQVHGGQPAVAEPAVRESVPAAPSGMSPLAAMSQIGGIAQSFEHLVSEVLEMACRMDPDLVRRKLEEVERQQSK